jgi:hypothetical protein
MWLNLPKNAKMQIVHHHSTNHMGCCPYLAIKITFTLKQVSQCLLPRQRLQNIVTKVLFPPLFYSTGFFKLKILTLGKQQKSNKLNRSS